MLKTSNPIFNKKTVQNFRAESSSQTMTINGAIQKTALLSLLVILGASYSWNQFIVGGSEVAQTWMIGGAIGGFITAIIIVIKKQYANILAPIYAIFEGLFLGAISAFFNQLFPTDGIVIRAIALTLGVLFAMLFAYRSGLIKPTEKLKAGVVAATGGIAIMYLISIVLGLFGVNLDFMYNSSPLGIGISLIIVVVAAFNLILDFDFIEQGAKAGLSKNTEWYAAFGLLVTLVWLYIEILRLLSLFAGRD